ncbi:MAG TPA: hypothetical protein VLI90_17740 [Tepidisphaeraceae bacterium]|nr:hypothetical protein [Tepidisphaeraceae bacterium]
MRFAIAPLLLPLPALMLSLLVGCAGNGATSPPQSGAAALIVDVKANPKAGYRPANYHVLVYDAPTPATPADFEKVDYAALDEVVVWVEPTNAAGATSGDNADLLPARLDVDPQKASDHLAAAVSVGQRLIFRNTGDKPGAVYSVSDGNNFHLGTLAPGARGEYTVQSPGLIEVVTTSLADPIATVYAAPTRWVRLTRAGQRIYFNDLPPGRYKIVSWHPRLPGHETTVNLPSDRVMRASIAVGVNGLPKIDQ